MMYAQIDVVGHRRRPPLGRLRRRRREPGQRAGHDHRRAQGPRRPDPDPGLLRRRRAAVRRPTARRSRRCRSTRTAYLERARRCRPSSARSGYTTLERRGDAADPRRQRHLGRLPGRGQQDDHPGPRPRQGQLPARRRPGSGPDLRGAPRLRRGDRPARRDRRRSRYLGGGLPSLTPIDHPATQAAARALEATFGRAPVYIREGGSIPVCASFDVDPRPAGRAPRASRRPTTTPTPPTSGWTSATTRRASGRSSGCLDELVDLPR